jgi:hypothetical protein
LVTPWDPTNERLDWLAEVTAGRGIATKWTGRTNLDVLAARRQPLVSYYFGEMVWTNPAWRAEHAERPAPVEADLASRRRRPTE